MVEQLVEPGGGGELEGGLAIALLAHGVDDVRALLPLLDHARDQLGRVLQVGVDHRHHIAAGVLQTRCERGLVAEVAREMDDAHTRSRRRQGGRVGAERRIGAAVVDQHQLERVVGHGGAGASPHERLDQLLLVVDGGYDA